MGLHASELIVGRQIWSNTQLATSVVQIAAWYIVGRGLSEFFGWNKWLENRQKQLEGAAAEAEYRDERTKDWRRKQLLIRYPEQLISAPGSEYVWQAQSARRTADKRSREDWMGSTGMTVKGCLILGYIALIGWAAFKILSGQFTFEHFMGTPLGVGSLVFTDLWMAHTQLRKWKQRRTLGKLAAVLLSLSTVFGVLAFIGIYLDIGGPFTYGDAAIAGLLFIFGIGAWSYSQPRTGDGG